MSIDEFNTDLPAFIEAGTEVPACTVKTLVSEWCRFSAWPDALRLSDVATDMVAAYKRHLLGEGYAKSTLRSTLLALSNVFSVALKDMRLLSGEKTVKGAGLPEPDQAFPPYPELAEIDKLLGMAEPRSPSICLLVDLGVFPGVRHDLSATQHARRLEARPEIPPVQQRPGANRRRRTGRIAFLDAPVLHAGFLT